MCQRCTACYLSGVVSLFRSHSSRCYRHSGHLVVAVGDVGDKSGVARDQPTVMLPDNLWRHLIKRRSRRCNNTRQPSGLAEGSLAATPPVDTPVGVHNLGKTSLNDYNQQFNRLLSDSIQSLNFRTRPKSKFITMRTPPLKPPG